MLHIAHLSLSQLKKISLSLKCGSGNSFKSIIKFHAGTQAQGVEINLIRRCTIT